MMDIQLDLIDSNDEVTLLRRELADMKAKQETMRRSLFARHNELQKLYESLKDEIDLRKAQQEFDYEMPELREVTGR